MTVRSVSYNPAFLTDDQLVAQFTVREHELARLLQSIRENTDAINQHLLVIAPPGAGKTTLVRRVVAEVRRDPELSGLWLPVLFGEEEYLVSTAGEFWLEAVLHLADATGDESWRDVHDVLLDESDEMRLADKALARLRDAATARGARILLVAENLHQLLGELHPDDAWAIRKVLQNEPWIMLLGTAISGFPAIERPSAPMYELFERIELTALDAAECDRLWASVTGAPLGPSRIRPIRILTGGSVRLLRMMAHFSIGRSFRELLDGLLEFLDDHTNYFKHNIEDLDATTERKAFIALADLWEPSTARDVARRGRLQVNETSTYLGRLVERGRVTVVGKRGRAKLYQVSERLYNIYHLMRRRGSAMPRVQALVEFMVSFYNPPSDGTLYESDGCSAQASLAADGVLRPDRLTTLLGSAPEDLRIHELQARLVDLAASDFAAELAELLPGHPLTQRVEPFAIALQLLNGEPDDRIPQELLAVAKDVAAKIRQRAKALAQ